MCGDIMNIWNVKSVANGLIRHTGTVSVALMSAEIKPESRQSRSIRTLISTKKLYSGGINRQQEQRLKNDTEASHKPKSWQFSVSKSIKNAIPTNARHGIENTVIDAETITQDTLTEKLLNRSLICLATDALSAAVRQLRLTILSHYQKAERTTLITYNHFVNLVTLGKATDESYL